MPLVALECRGLEPVAFHPEDDFLVVAASGKVFDSVDLRRARERERGGGECAAGRCRLAAAPPPSCRRRRSRVCACSLAPSPLPRSERDWSDFDEKAGDSVGVYGFESKFETTREK